jgi:hypothetical protein
MDDTERKVNTEHVSTGGSSPSPPEADDICTGCSQCEFLPTYPVGCPPSAAKPFDEKTLYRTVHNETPDAESFKSYAELGEELEDPEMLNSWHSISLFSKAKDAKRLAVTVQLGGVGLSREAGGCNPSR